MDKLAATYARAYLLRNYGRSVANGAMERLRQPMPLTRSQSDRLCQAFRIWAREKCRGWHPRASDVVTFNVFVTFVSDVGQDCTHPEVLALFRRRGLVGDQL